MEIFADAYGWSKNQILDEIYPEELPLYFHKIAERNKNRALEKLGEQRILLGIAVAPYTERGSGIRELHRKFDEAEREIRNPGKKEKQENRIKKAMEQWIKREGEK